MRLGVNIDHVATLRQARKGRYPDPVAAAALAELGGADQITLHVREDRRHVNDRADAQPGELHTGRYCEARTSRDRARELARIVEGAKAATKLGLRVAAGHGLDYWNVKPVAEIAEITELNIGYAIVCRAILTGLERAVRDLKDLIG